MQTLWSSATFVFIEKAFKGEEELYEVVANFAFTCGAVLPELQLPGKLAEAYVKEFCANTQSSDCTIVQNTHPYVYIVPVPCQKVMLKAEHSPHAVFWVLTKAEELKISPGTSHQ